MKTHNGHYASCLCCTHLEIEDEKDYSEYTLGAGFTMACRRLRFPTMYVSSIDLPVLNTLQTKAQECDEFTPREEST